MFWSGFEQAGSSLNLFAERFTQRAFAGLDDSRGLVSIARAGVHHQPRAGDGDGLGEAGGETWSLRCR